MVHSVSIPQMNPSFNEQNFNPKMNEVNRLKRNLTLELFDCNRRRSKFGPEVLDSPLLLSSPDFNKCNLRSPDIAKILLETSTTLQTPTPTTMRQLFPKSNCEDEIYAESYDNTLSDISADTSNDTMIIVPKSNAIMNGYVYDNSYPTAILDCGALIPEGVKIKEEPQPQTVPSVGSSPPVSPINMDAQEQIKKDRKKARNREAAAKCRKKKLEKIAQLEGKVKQLKEENNELSSVARRLKEEVASLQVKILKHHRNGCPIVIPS